MKYLLLLTTLLLTGCSSHVSATLFLKEDNRMLSDLYGDTCTESGYIVIKKLNSDKWELITSYYNCSVKTVRQLQEFEVKHWITPPEAGLK